MIKNKLITMTEQEVIENAYRRVVEKIFENYYIDQDIDKFKLCWAKVRNAKEIALSIIP
jgi:hypothetical protein